jgi:hypothetical protein
MMKKPIAGRVDRSHLAVPKETWQKLKREAAIRGVSMIAATVEAVELWIASPAPSLEQSQLPSNPPVD